MAPKEIPKEIANIKEEELPPHGRHCRAWSAAFPAACPAALPAACSAASSVGSVRGRRLRLLRQKEDAQAGDSAAIRVGGNVQAAKLIRQPKPVYPPLAKQARIQGTVRFNAVIGKDGTIQNLTVVSGHPLLIPSAQEAVKQWVYKPTLLNGEPVEVVTQIDVNFTLSQ